MKLAAYRGRRDPAQTTEPLGTEPDLRRGPTREGAFVVHLHDARHRHWDLRMEAGGVLVSFAVPKGPSLVTTDRRLAIRTEDHPLEYVDFEAVIPEGNYGAGPMIAWDRGRVHYGERPVEEGLERGHIHFELAGYKLRGSFTLVRTKGRETPPEGTKQSPGKDWILFKRSDAFAAPTAAEDPVHTSPRSVLSGLTVEELRASSQVAAELEARAASLGAPVGEFDARQMAPMLCAAEGAPIRDPAWIYEIKLDGVRAIAIKDPSGPSSGGSPGVLLRSRSLRDITATYPEVALAVRTLAPERLVIDGEIVAFDPSGRPNFQRLAQRAHLESPWDVRWAALETPVVFMAFDVLRIGPRDLRGLPLSARKEVLHALLPGKGVLRALDHLDGDAAPLLAFCAEHDLEGLVAKRAASPYRPGPERSGDWVKMKRTRDDDFVVVGFTRGEGSRAPLGALDVASFDRGQLINRGKVGSGLDGAEVAELLRMLAPLATATQAAKGALSRAPRGRTHVQPEVVVRVRHRGFSEEGHVLHGVYEGRRGDISPAECTAGPKWIEDPHGSVAAALRPESPKRQHRSASPRAKGAPPPITRPEKVLWPQDHLTKGDLIAYYQAIAPAMLPYLRDRPVVLVRYPDGIAGKSFYQWNLPPRTPEWLRRARIPGRSGDQVEAFVLADERSLVYVANLAAIPLHMFASRVGSPEACDFATVDFDVEGADLRRGIVLAMDLQRILEEVGLEGFVKTSGQSGLHVLVPLGPGVSYGSARALADVLGQLVCLRHPDLGTMERAVKKRGPKVYVDTGQTGPTRTIVAPWSVRAVPGATVSMPLRWDELGPALDPRAFNLRTGSERFESTGDPMSRLLAAHPDLGQAMDRLGALVGERRPATRHG